MHWRLGSSARSRTIVRFRGVHIWDKYFMSRIYMEYCPHGDLGGLFCKHAKVNWDQNLVQDEDGQSMDPIRIPIRAIWSFFEDLAEAACKIAYGRDPLDPASVPLNWQTLVHRDVKPHNVFLGLPRTPGERGIPELKLGDFGLAVPHNYPAMRNPRDMVQEGTQGWRAPEHNLRAIHLQPTYPLSSATDIWAIGRIMLALVELSHPRPLNVLYGEPHDAQIWHAPGKDERLTFYGDRLYELIESCLLPVPDERITASDLLEDIREYLDDNLGGRPPRLEEGDILEYNADMEWAV
jgi:serine/threonine protein kinase